MLIDSNIIIYASHPQNAWLRQFIAQYAPAVSAISYVEVLGYHSLTEEDKALLETFFDAATSLPIGTRVLEQAAKLRQVRKMTLGDALVAATALVHGRTLVTRNTGDFVWIPALELLNPFDEIAG